MYHLSQVFVYLLLELISKFFKSTGETIERILCDFTLKSMLFYNHAYEAWILAINVAIFLLL